MCHALFSKYLNGVIWLKINSLYPQVLIPNKINYSKDDYTNKSNDTQDLSEISKLKRLISPNVPKAADPQTNSINIKPGEIKNIGSVDGYPLNISFDSSGMSSTSFAIMINANDPIDSPRSQLALKVFNSHTPLQRDKAGLISSRFQFLFSVANGSMSVNQYNSTDLGQNAMSTSELLTSLGIDVSKSFSFNGKSFSLDGQGDLHAVLPASPLNVTQ